MAQQVTEADGQSAADTESSGQKKLVEEAKQRLALAIEVENDGRLQALEDLEFSAGKQWPAEVERERAEDGRPCLVINRISQFVQQLTNDQRQNRPSIKVHPVDDQGDVETAKVIQGLVRHIEYNSSADTAYDTAFESAVRHGFGFFRVLTGYVSEQSFDQEILIKRIRNPFSVYLDPGSQEPDGSDANWAMILDDISKEEFVSRYPDSELASEDDWGSVGNNSPEWVKKDGARIVEYFYKEYRDAEICMMSDGQVLEREQAEQISAGSGAPNEYGEVVRQVSILGSRKTRIPVIKWCKLNGVEVLEETEWLGKYIPIVPVYGAEHYINGKRILRGIVHDAKDPQRMYNYWKSAETEAIALAPRSPFVAAKGQIEGFESDWESANRRNHSVLEYNPKAVGGEVLPPPQRMTAEPAVGAITQAAMYAADDLKATTGIYDAALGAKSNETSGIAIQKRNNQAQTSNFHFVDNLTRSLRHTGRIIVDMIPKIYDTARTARIIGDDGTQEVVKLNTPFQKEGAKEPVLYAVDTGQYDVTVDVGPSYASKRQEAVSSMMEVTRAVPSIMPMIGDLMVKNMDWPGAQEMAERLKKALPPGLADDKDKAKPEVPPQVQAQMQQMGQMIDGLTKQLHAAHDTIDTKRVELESRERIEMAKLETQASIELAKLQSKESLQLLTHQIAEISGRMNMLGFNEPLPSEAADQAPNQFAPPPSGGMPAESGGMGNPPTGGASPGSPMEEMPPNEQPDAY